MSRIHPTNHNKQNEGESKDGIAGERNFETYEYICKTYLCIS